MSLYILKPGLLDTIQDHGRYGSAHLGINPSGAMDSRALAVSNALVGNLAGEAALELHFPAAEILVEKGALLSLAGADFMAHANGIPIPANAAFWLAKGTVLKFRQLARGARCYLAVQGGFDLTPWLGSYSTHLAAGVGGWQGRALQAGDRLPFREVGVGFLGSDKNPLVLLKTRVGGPCWLPNPSVIRFCAGPEFGWLGEGSNLLLQHEFHITGQSDRMGYRLDGPKLQLQHAQDMLSSAVIPGSIQLLPEGQLIVLMADSQTTGGYPRIGQVVQADLPKLAQLGAGQKISFQEVPLALAFEALFQQDLVLRKLRIACSWQLTNNQTISF